MPSDLSLFSLWLPILLAAVAVFVASFLAWMVLPHHKPDFKAVKDEDGFLATLRERHLEPGQYAFPFCDDYSKLKDPDVRKRYDAGPHGVMIVWPGAPNMGRALIASFIFYVVVGVMVAFLSSMALHRGDGFMEVFRFTGTAAIMTYVLGSIPNGIWYGRPVRGMVMDALDTIAYGLITGLLFALLWPGA